MNSAAALTIVGKRFRAALFASRIISLESLLATMSSPLRARHRPTASRHAGSIALSR